MAVTKIWTVTDSISRVIDYCNNPEKTKFTDLEHVVKYASDEEKVMSEGERFYAVTGVNCRAETAAQIAKNHCQAPGGFGIISPE